MTDHKSKAEELLKSVSPKKEDPGFALGLEGVVAARSSLCQIDGANGKLYYCGYPIEELAAGSTYEECCFLLWHGRLPRQDEFEALNDLLIENRTLPSEVIDFIKLIPHTAHPMDVVRTVVSLLATFDQNPERSPEANLSRAISLTAKLPTIVATFHRLRQNQKLIPPKANLSHAGNFLHMLHGKKVDPSIERVMDIALILHLDHEMNASTFAALVTASTLSDLYSAVASGIGTLKGPLHGGANEKVLEALQEIGDPKKVEKFVDESLASKRRLMGFGHRVYKNYDPRARVLKEYARKMSEKTRFSRFYQINEKLEKVMIERKGKQGIFPNVDLYSGIVYHQMGIATDLFTPIFAISRVTGWTAHVIEYWTENRLFRPNSIYTGFGPRKFVPIAQR